MGERLDVVYAIDVLHPAASRSYLVFDGGAPGADSVESF
jgi:hypothetical protein